MNGYMVAALLVVCSLAFMAGAATNELRHTLKEIRERRHREEMKGRP